MLDEKQDWVRRQANQTISPNSQFYILNFPFSTLHSQFSSLNFSTFESSAEKVNSPLFTDDVPLRFSQCFQLSTHDVPLRTGQCFHPSTFHSRFYILNSQPTSSTPPWLSETRYPPNLTPCRIRSHQIIAELFELSTTERLVFCFEPLRFDQMGF